jgi:Na+/citrate or Na+/malate symporter
VIIVVVLIFLSAFCFRAYLARDYYMQHPEEVFFMVLCFTMMFVGILAQIAYEYWEAGTDLSLVKPVEVIFPMLISVGVYCTVWQQVRTVHDLASALLTAFTSGFTFRVLISGLAKGKASDSAMKGE